MENEDDVRRHKGRPQPKGKRRNNQRFERFLLELYAGKPPAEAYELAGYAPDAGNARRLAGCPEARARIAEFFMHERQLIEVEAMRARRERDIIAYSNVANYFEPVLDDKGQPTGRVRVKDFTKLPREIAAAIQSIKPTKLGWEVRLHDKDAALRSIEKRVEQALGVPAEEQPEPLGKKEQQVLDAQNPEAGTTLGELMLQRQVNVRTH